MALITHSIPLNTVPIHPNTLHKTGQTNLIVSQVTRNPTIISAIAQITRLQIDRLSAGFAFVALGGSVCKQLVEVDVGLPFATCWSLFDTTI